MSRVMPWHAREVMDRIPDQRCELRRFHGAPACVGVEHVGLKSIAVTAVTLQRLLSLSWLGSCKGRSIPHVRHSEWLRLSGVCIMGVSELGRQIVF